MPFDSTTDLADVYGPRTPFGRAMHAFKYRSRDERYDDYATRYSRVVSEPHNYRRTLRYVRDQVLLPAGRQQFSLGRPDETTAYNCFVGGTIPDSYVGIMNAVTEGGMTMRTGGGVGWDFSTLRPRGELIRGLGPGSYASGPVSFMNIWDANCATILTAGHRRGAMMASLRVDHPDIMEFIGAKRATGALKNFNISVAVTDAFMEALANDGLYELRFGDTVHARVRAQDVWARIMESNWDWAEPGILFIDRINQRNPLYYCENIASTNPCSEQPLPPYGACLLGSVNLVKVLTPSYAGNPQPDHDGAEILPFPARRVVDPRASRWDVDWELLDDVVDCAVRAFDNVPDQTNFPLPQQREEAFSKRRMGLGLTGMANTIEIIGERYGSPGYLAWQDRIAERVAHQAYRTSIELAREKGPFPLFDRDKYLDGWFCRNVLDDELRDGIKRHGIRNGLLLSVAPTGTISMAADNVSSGIEPPYAIRTRLDIQTGEGKQSFEAPDYAYEFFGVRCQTAEETTAEQHVDVLCGMQHWVDSSISKTCNVNGQVAGSGPGVTFPDFKNLYLRAWEGGAKGCTTFNTNGKLMGVRHNAEADATPSAPDPEDAAVCTLDQFGRRTCAAEI